ncbi:acetyl-coenzyme A carboxylase carboxyl transferase subunit beta [Collibacillus ludicampi]|uniref:Acetyl-coenzyme A carboxylase carboxyl transferase subunit beta n=1 Tax=Collibacillus ludicampi TaxID=2771369 RepID=A0AAV4LHW1_9BACL|nr:acetyl-CoA carboxylase, carboxyltransferase subunit beta [Collibacillus ludicampi]GIM47109.1 acetyl-coenzyme A carboxylase carboxyl transferase subunit beta [Collibacillus ludicampi]
MLKDLFQKKVKYATLSTQDVAPRKESIPEGIMTKCKKCGELLLTKELDKHLKTCPRCGYHFPLSAPERIQWTLDEGHFFEYDAGMTSVDPLRFPDYPAKLEAVKESTGLQEAVVTGEGTLEGFPVVIGVMDSRFIMGSMGSVVGEKITRAVERAVEKKYPLILFTASGGARMQEGTFSLMQMAKISAALRKLGDARLPYIAVLTHPTTGGVTASFAMLGDLNIAEPGALIGFAGRRVIEQTIRQKLPDDFQTAEFLLKHGMLDKVVHRKEMKHTLAKILEMHRIGGAPNAR